MALVVVLTPLSRLAASPRLCLRDALLARVGVVRSLGAVLVASSDVEDLVERRGYSGYSAAKAASWSMTSGLRAQLAPQGGTVTSLHVGYMDTDMAAYIDDPKSDPADVARALLDAVAAGEHEVLFDDVSQRVQQGLAGGVSALYPQIARG